MLKMGQVVCSYATFCKYSLLFRLPAKILCEFIIFSVRAKHSLTLLLEEYMLREVQFMNQIIMQFFL